MIREYVHKTSTGVALPLGIRTFKVNQEMLLHQYYYPEARDNWCQAAPKTCSQYGCRPCCPPNFPVFEKLNHRENLYIIIVGMDTQDYLDAYPKVANTSMRYYGTSTGVHYLTRGTLYKIVSALVLPGDQGFKVGGCSGCQVKKTGTCNKILMPALEATGINVVGLYEFLASRKMEWNKDGVLMGRMVAVGGLLTDREIPYSEVRQAIREAL